MKTGYEMPLSPYRKEFYKFIKKIIFMYPEVDALIKEDRAQKNHVLPYVITCKFFHIILKDIEKGVNKERTLKAFREVEIAIKNENHSFVEMIYLEFVETLAIREDYRRLYWSIKPDFLREDVEGWIRALEEQAAEWKRRRNGIH